MSQCDPTSRQDHGSFPPPNPGNLHLDGVLAAAGPALVAAWARHRHPDDILVLADLRRPEGAIACADQWGWPAVERELREAAAVGRRPLMAYLQPVAVIESLARSDDPSHRASALDLRETAARIGGPGAVPLLVIIPGGLWATAWAPPGSNVEFISPIDPGAN